ncbi:MAG: hypothetical protein A2075_11320 [Geobacteraceae bacterium GWC2_58_44]|nr:MAG: hypothetical protein A2075_11320 [Geobacteraceae bacterium GWC2_58_44]
MWIAGRVLLSQRGDDFFRLKKKVLDTWDPDDIHDLRVASRRVREGLELFSPCYQNDAVNRLVRRVKRVTRFLGEMRNMDEALLFFDALAGELDEGCRAELEVLILSIASQRQKGRREFKAGLKQSVPSSENYGITVGYRQQKLKSKVLKFDPTSPGGGVRLGGGNFITAPITARKKRAYSD